MSNPDLLLTMSCYTQMKITCCKQVQQLKKLKNPDEAVKDEISRLIAKAERLEILSSAVMEEYGSR